MTSNGFQELVRGLLYLDGEELLLLLEEHHEGRPRAPFDLSSLV